MSVADAGEPIAPPDSGGSVDADNPWLGLASFSEESQAYFFGREGEVAELTRRVQRKLLTALLRQASGLIDHLIPSIARLHDTREWRARIVAAERSERIASAR